MQTYIQSLKLTKNIKRKDVDTLIHKKYVLLVQDAISLMEMKNLEIQMIQFNRICSILLSKAKIKIILKCPLKMIEVILEEEVQEEISRTTPKTASTLTTNLNQETLNKKMILEVILIKKIILNKIIKTHLIQNSKQLDADILTCMVLVTTGINAHTLTETMILGVVIRLTCSINHSSLPITSTKTQQSINICNLKCQYHKTYPSLNSIKKL
jgi:hypothetical protein